jgi:hypothetical protein
VDTPSPKQLQEQSIVLAKLLTPAHSRCSWGRRCEAGLDRGGWPVRGALSSKLRRRFCGATRARSR